MWGDPLKLRYRPQGRSIAILAATPVWPLRLTLDALAEDYLGMSLVKAQARESAGNAGILCVLA